MKHYYKMIGLMLVSTLVVCMFAGCSGATTSSVGVADSTTGAEEQIPALSADQSADPEAGAASSADNTTNPDVETQQPDEPSDVSPSNSTDDAATGDNNQPTVEPATPEEAEQVGGEDLPEPIAQEGTATPAEAPTTVPQATENIEPQPSSNEEALNSVQKNSIAMLNYLTVLTQEISSSKGSRLFLEQAYSSLINNTYPNAVDVWTQAELDDLLDTLESFRMVSVKRDRLQYIYEHNKAQAFRSAIPNPISILNVVGSKSLLKSVASLAFVAVDSVSSYNSYNEQNDLQYLKDGWELDDAEASELNTMRRNSFSYMINMVRDYSLPGDLALNENAVSDFVEWKSKTNVVSRISILESNEKTYEAMGSYWLTLAKSYYENGNYAKCLKAIDKYESITSRIFRRDYEYAATLPYAILAAQETTYASEYEALAKRYSEAIVQNTDPKDWASHYFVALIYMDLYSSTKNNLYIDKAYKLVLDNVTYLVDEQREMNATWLEDVKEVVAGKDASKQEKKDINQYNKMLKEDRKTALPPVSEPLCLNCDLLFALAEKKGITQIEKNKIDAILHENGENLFLIGALDNTYRFNSRNTYPSVESMGIAFDGKELVIPAYAVSPSAAIKVMITSGTQTTTVEDWVLEKVNRPKKSGELDFTATYKSTNIKSVQYNDGTAIQIYIYPRAEKADLMLSIKYVVKVTTYGPAWSPIKSTTYERIA